MRLVQGWWQRRLWEQDSSESFRATLGRRGANITFRPRRKAGSPQDGHWAWSARGRDGVGAGEAGHLSHHTERPGRTGPHVDGSLGLSRACVLVSPRPTQP